MRRLSSAMAAFAFLGVALPAWGQGVSGDAGPPTTRGSTFLESPVEGGVHIMPSQQTKHDSDMIEELAVDSNAAKRNLAAIMKFVDAEGGIYGTEKACFPHRAVLFQRCAFLVLDHWKDVYGEDLPKVQIKDGSRTEDIIVQMWGRVSDRSEAISRDALSKCDEVDTAMRQSKIWKYCSEPDWNTVQEDTSEVIGTH